MAEHSETTTKRHWLIFIPLLFLFYILQYLDCALTDKYVFKLNILEELNPIAICLVNKWGTDSLYIAKALVTAVYTAIIIPFYNLYPKTFMSVLIVSILTVLYATWSGIYLEFIA